MIFYEMPAHIQGFDDFANVVKLKSLFADERVFLQPVCTQPKCMELEMLHNMSHSDLVDKFDALIRDPKIIFQDQVVIQGVLGKDAKRRIVYDAGPGSGKYSPEAFEKATQIKRRFPDENVVFKTNGRIIPIELHTTPTQEEMMAQWKEWYPPASEQNPPSKIDKILGRQTDSNDKSNSR